MPASDDVLSDLATLTGTRTGLDALASLLPAGHVVTADEGDGDPCLWISAEPVSADLWTTARSLVTTTGLWPLLLWPLDGDDDRPWDGSELFPEPPPSQPLDPAALLAGWWQGNVGNSPDDPPAETAPLGRAWPGLAPTPQQVADSVPVADRYVVELVAGSPSARLGLVAAGRGSDALVVTGWDGPVNHAGIAQIAAVLRRWEDGFGAEVVGVGFDQLFVSVSTPPATEHDALLVAAEHFACCPDNVWQNTEPATLAAYAAGLVSRHSWEFWWD